MNKSKDLLLDVVLTRFKSLLWEEVNVRFTTFKNHSDTKELNNVANRLSDIIIILRDAGHDVKFQYNKDNPFLYDSVKIDGVEYMDIQYWKDLVA